MTDLTIGLICVLAGVIGGLLIGFLLLKLLIPPSISRAFEARENYKTIIKASGKNEYVAPTQEVIEKIVTIAIKGHELKKTSKEIIEEMNSLPEYKP